MTLASFLSVGVGGFIGCTLRYGVTVLINQRVTSHFPVATFLINILGSLIIGIVFGLAAQGSMNDNARLFFVTGICGGFTTFSAFSIENLKLIQQGEVMTALIYTLLSIVLGILAAGVGVVIGKAL